MMNNKEKVIQPIFQINGLFFLKKTFWGKNDAFLFKKEKFQTLKKELLEALLRENMFLASFLLFFFPS